MSSRKSKDTSQELENRLKNKRLSFSFEYYEPRHEKYCLSDWNKEQTAKTLERLKDISTKTFNDMLRDKRVYHFGEVIWERTIHKTGFDNVSAKRLPAFHIALLGVNRQLARVYGAYSQGVFYVVWFDLKHKIWPTALRNT